MAPVGNVVGIEVGRPDGMVNGKLDGIATGGTDAPGAAVVDGCVVGSVPVSAVAGVGGAGVGGVALAGRLDSEPVAAPDGLDLPEGMAIESLLASSFFDCERTIHHTV